MAASRRTSRGTCATALLACLLAFLATGCRKRIVQAAPPVVVNPPAPAAQPAPTESKPATEPRPQPAHPNPAPAPPKPAASKPAPIKGSTTTKSPVVVPEPAEPAPAPKPAAPQISPRLSPAQQVEYQRKTEDAIAAVEKNLQQANGRRLNAAQLDTVEKIRGFLAQSREAIHESDWVRARNLAEKALTLSNELVASL